MTIPGDLVLTKCTNFGKGRKGQCWAGIPASSMNKREKTPFSNTSQLVLHSTQIQSSRMLRELLWTTTWGKTSTKLVGETKWAEVLQKNSCKLPTSSPAATGRTVRRHAVLPLKMITQFGLQLWLIFEILQAIQHAQKHGSIAIYIPLT